MRNDAAVSEADALLAQARSDFEARYAELGLIGAAPMPGSPGERSEDRLAGTRDRRDKRSAKAATALAKPSKKQAR